MTTLTAVGLPPATGRAGFGGALRSEWTKIRSVRSTVWTLLATAIVTIGISTLFAWGSSGHTDIQDVPTFDPVRSAMFGIVFGQLVIVVIGAMTMSSEYATGMIRTSLTSMPRRGVVFGAKLSVFTGVALVTGLFCSFTSFFIGQAFFAKVSVHDFRGPVGAKGPGPAGHPVITIHDLSTTIGAPHVLQAVIGGGLYLAVSGLLAFGLAALLRHTAGAITAAIGVLFVTFIMAQFLPSDWAKHVDKWVPFFAGGQLWGLRKLGDGSIPMLSPWTGFAVFAAYAAAVIVAGAVLFKKRDA
ncbi:ABC transporter permease [Streptacidiphilus carbonis]|jgi:ABC-2 type transport system permease protein|uniref:ABC transporter permease n=1 Tax=Streptacidiphilus carbonis TaxID=105422 RepID=UPI0005AB660B|nr:ABC transporter permease [Streptacidiphilus carbonis]